MQGNHHTKAFPQPVRFEAQVKCQIFTRVLQKYISTTHKLQKALCDSSAVWTPMSISENVKMTLYYSF